MSNTVKYPAKVSAAVVAVMAQVKRISKNEKNSHGNYQFAGIDAFIETVNPLCADAGLVVIQNEKSVDIRQSHQKAPWLVVEYEFVILHESGDALPPVSRTVMVPATGPQSAGIAQSYALKNFMRSQFLIPTGDKEDADTIDPKETLPPPAVFDAEACYKNLKNMIATAESTSELDEFGETHKRNLNSLNNADPEKLEKLRSLKQVKRDQLTKQNADPNPEINSIGADNPFPQEDAA